MLTSNYQPSKKFLEQKIKNSSRKNSTRQSAFHEWWLICHEWWRPILQVIVSFMISVTTVPWSWKRTILNFFLAPRLVMSGDKFVMSDDTRAGHFFWLVSNGSFCIKNVFNGSFSLRGFIFYQEQSWNIKRKLSKHI